MENHEKAGRKFWFLWNRSVAASKMWVSAALRRPFSGTTGVFSFWETRQKSGGERAVEWNSYQRERCQRIKQLCLSVYNHPALFAVWLSAFVPLIENGFGKTSLPELVSTVRGWGGDMTLKTLSCFLNLSRACDPHNNYPTLLSEFDKIIRLLRHVVFFY